MVEFYPATKCQKVRSRKFEKQDSCGSGCQTFPKRVLKFKYAKSEGVYKKLKEKVPNSILSFEKFCWFYSVGSYLGLVQISSLMRRRTRKHWRTMKNKRRAWTPQQRDSTVGHHSINERVYNWRGQAAFQLIRCEGDVKVGGPVSMRKGESD